MSLLDNLLGILRVRVKRGVNLAVRDVSSSDPYVVLKLGRQVLSLSLSLSLDFHKLQRLFHRLRIQIYFAETQNQSGEEKRKPTMGRRFVIHSH